METWPGEEYRKVMGDKIIIIAGLNFCPPPTTFSADFLRLCVASSTSGQNTLVGRSIERDYWGLCRGQKDGLSSDSLKLGMLIICFRELKLSANKLTEFPLQVLQGGPNISQKVVGLAYKYKTTFP